MFKIVDVNTEKTLETGLDFMEARWKIDGKDHLCLMDDDQDVSEALERRQRLIEALESK